MNKKIDLRFSLIVVLIVMAAMSRLLPHPPNFTPIGGIALFGAAHFTKKYWAFIIPFIGLFISDLVINNIFYAEYYDSFVLFTKGGSFKYLAFAAIVLLGMNTLKKVKASNVLLSSLGASILFFAVSNFGVWATGSMYSKDITGLIACYTAGIPFFWNTLAGDLFYVSALFGSFAALRATYPKQLATINA